MKKPQLAVVMPVFNEEGAIGNVIKKWTKEFKRLGIDFYIHAYDDGSTDNSLRILTRLASANKNLVVHDKSNSGHGPTILQGYRDNSDAEWIFQIDSDDELGTKSFERLWEKRNEYDFLTGKRVDRKSSLIRHVLSFVSRVIVRIFYGPGVYDVNVPYRLMRSEKFKDTFNKIPSDIFAPNVIISGMACHNKYRILEVPVSHQNRATGEVSIKRMKLFKAAVKSFFQTINFFFKFRFSLFM